MVQPELSSAGAAIRAWPGSGIDDRHVSAYTVLLQQLARLAGAASQKQAHLAQVLHDGDAPLQALLAALDSLLALYDKSGDNERDMVLGLLDGNRVCRHAAAAPTGSSTSIPIPSAAAIGS